MIVPWIEPSRLRAPCQNCSLCLVQTHEGLPVVDADGQPTKRVHAFGPRWRALYAPGYESIVFKSPSFKCAPAPPLTITFFARIYLCLPGSSEAFPSSAAMSSTLYL